MSEDDLEAKAVKDPYDESVQEYGYRMLYENHFEENRHFFEATLKTYRHTTRYLQARGVNCSQTQSLRQQP